MANRVTFSGDHQAISDIALHHADLESALRNYFNSSGQSLAARFVGYSSKDLKQELQNRLAEIELSSSLAILAAIEASFRIDYLQRCQQKKKDAISRAFREIFADKGFRTSLEDDILGVWAERFDGSKTIIGELRGALKFHHWLAHGRYWTPKLGRRYDFNDIYTIADAALQHFDLIA